MVTRYCVAYYVAIVPNSIVLTPWINCLLCVVCLITEDSGNVYTFGGGQYGQLGCGERQVSEPTQAAVEIGLYRSIKGQAVQLDMFYINGYRE